jgi:hypothetical protein
VVIQVTHDQEFVPRGLKWSQEGVQIVAKGFPGVWIFLTGLAEKVPLLRVHSFCASGAGGLIADLVHRDNCDSSAILAVDADPASST